MYIGVDCSTQQLKLVVTDENGQILHLVAVSYENDLKIPLEIVDTEKGAVVEQNAKTWKTALLTAFDRLKHLRFDFSKVKGISGAGQQHGTVYFKSQNFDYELKNLAFDGKAPIWMDASTHNQCDQLTDLVGSKEILKGITGNYAFPRFSASQILKRKIRENEIKQICLVSNFIASLLCDEFVPIDLADGSGMNLLDL